jgi:hypothetical protein
MLFVFSTLPVIAQPGQRQRTQEFEKLNVFIGKWQAKGRVYPGKGIPTIEINGEPTFEWTMHKMWLMFKSGEGRLQGHGYITWDIELGKYVFFWFDNLLTKPTEYHGNWLDSQILVFNGEIHLRRKITYSRIKWQIISENEMNMVREISIDGINFRANAEMNYMKGR